MRCETYTQPTSNKTSKVGQPCKRLSFNEDLSPLGVVLWADLFIYLDLFVVLRHIQQPGSYCDG